MRCWNIFPHEIRSDGQLPVPAIDKNRQLNLGGAAHLEKRVDGRPGCAPGIENIVHQHDALARNGKRHGGFIQFGLRVGAGGGEIVPVEGNIQHAYGHGLALNGGDFFPDRPGQRLAPAADAHQRYVVAAAVALQYFMGDARQRAVHHAFIH